MESKTIASWEGAHGMWDIVIVTYANGYRQTFLENDMDGDITRQDMTRDELMAIVAGLQNALAELDGYGDE